MKKKNKKPVPARPAKQKKPGKPRSPRRKTISADRYTYRIEWNSAAQNYSGTCLEFPAFSVSGITPEDALKTIITEISILLEKLIAAGTTPPESLGLRQFKGNLTLRIPSELHHDLVVKAAEEGVSLNQLILSKL